jgi:hypothetical protein
MNRLNLDWNLNLKSERVEFAQNYLASIKFEPTEDELETISNYILWGKNSTNEKDGPARLKEEGIFLESKWNGSTPIESLDELAESPSFSENDLRPLSAPVPRKVRETFSREEARRHASPVILENLEALWSQIDTTELTLNFYELAHGKRKNPPREELTNRLSTIEIDAARARSAKLNQRTYLKLKHQLIALRQQQYNFQDTYHHVLTPLKMKPYQEAGGNSEFGADINVKPLGLNARGLFDKLYQKVFNKDHFPEPDEFSAADLKSLGRLLWKENDLKKVFDFGEVAHLSKLVAMWDELEDKAEESESLRIFLDTARVYISLAQLDPKEELILEMKKKKKSNEEIRCAIEEKFGHRYQPNYISTLYCKKVLVKIAEAAKFHREVCENLFFPENFKKCKDCGKVLLLDERNWVRRKRSSDGFSPRCKKCEKVNRDKSKLK